MGTYSRYPGRSFGIGSFFPPGVKWLIIVNVAIFFVLFFAGLFNPELVFDFVIGNFGLRAAAVAKGALWQPFTYLFLHDPRTAWHVLFNMLTLWMFGADLERDWGTKRFLQYYLVCGVGAGLCDVVANLTLRTGRTPTIGASGAIYGVLLAFGLLYPTRTVFFSFLFPIQAKYFVLIMGVIAFMSSLSGDTAVSNVAHLGGMLFGYLYLRFRLHRFYLRLPDLRSEYVRWRRRRLQQKFKVYMQKRGQQHDRDRDRWVN